MSVPLAQHAGEAGAKTLGSILAQTNAMAYQIGEASLAVGGVFVCSLLFQTRLIPRSLAGWGVIGYALFLAGAIAEILGIHIGLMLSVPGGLFEVAFALWLIIKGFEPEAYGQNRDDPVALVGTA
jgi:hypothetical protein